MTEKGLLERCGELQRARGDMFPLWSLTGEVGVETLVDPFTSTCFVFLEDGVVSVPTSQEFDVIAGTPYLDRPQDYVSDRPEEVQRDLERSLEAAVAHLLRVAKLAGRLQVTEVTQVSE
ncbi:MAG: hypothetical protein AB7Y46_15785 [Armatimonadota bacterium]